MLDTLMKFGAYRVNYFEPQNRKNPEAFGFYIRADVIEGQPYNREAKHQLYLGLNLIEKELGMGNLIGIYLDVNSPQNFQQSAYQQMKMDILSGYFHRILFLDQSVISGCQGTEEDLIYLASVVGWVEILTWQEARLVSKIISEPVYIG